MKTKRILSAAVTVIILLGAGGDILPCGEVSDTCITASAEEVCTFDEATGTLTLRGSISGKALKEWASNEKVTSIIAAEGCVFPQNSQSLFSGEQLVRQSDGSLITEYRWQKLQYADISKADTSGVTQMSHLFSKLPKLKTVNMSGTDTSKVGDMSCMFMDCYELADLNISGINTSEVRAVHEMFYGCRSLTSLDVSGFDTSKVYGMSYMFAHCSSLTSLDVSGFDTSSVWEMSEMFSGCSSLTALDLSGFDTSKVEKYKAMFYGCTKLQTIYASHLWDMSKAEASNGLFGSCVSLVGGNGTAYSKEHTDSTYARIDSPKSPGYFTYKSAMQTGDVNDDGRIDIEDAAQLINHINGIRALTEDEFIRADADRNSKADIEDAVAIIAHVNGIKAIT